MKPLALLLAAISAFRVKSDLPGGDTTSHPPLPRTTRGKRCEGFGVGGRVGARPPALPGDLLVVEGVQGGDGRAWPEGGGGGCTGWGQDNRFHQRQQHQPNDERHDDWQCFQRRYNGVPNATADQLQRGPARSRGGHLPLTYLYFIRIAASNPKHSEGFYARAIDGGTGLDLGPRPMPLRSTSPIAGHRQPTPAEVSVMPRCEMGQQ